MLSASDAPGCSAQRDGRGGAPAGHSIEDVWIEAGVYDDPRFDLFPPENVAVGLQDGDAELDETPREREKRIVTPIFQEMLKQDELRREACHPALTRPKTLPGQEDLFIYLHGFFILDLKKLLGPHLERVTQGVGQLPCVCGSNRCFLSSKGPDWEKLKRIQCLSTTDYVLPYQYKSGCGRTVYSHDGMLLQFLRNKGLGFALDAVPYTFGTRINVATALLQQGEALVSNVGGASLAAAAQAIRAQMLHARLERLSTVAVFLATRYNRDVFSNKDRIKDIAVNLGLTEVQTWQSCNLPSEGWIRKMLQLRLTEVLEYQQRCLAAVDAGPKGVMSIDTTHAAAKLVRANGARTFSAVLTMLNYLGEPALATFTDSEDQKNIEMILLRLRDNICKSGGQMPRVIYCDYPPLFERAVANVFGGDVQAKQDHWHAMDRIHREIPAQHSLFYMVVKDSHACFFDFYDGELKKEAEKQLLAETSPHALDYRSSVFKTRYKKLGGRWSTPVAEELQGRLLALLDKYKAMQLREQTICQRSKQDLVTERFCTAIRNVAASAAQGYLTDPWPTDEMYYRVQNQWNSIRSTSQLESRHRRLREEFCGIMGPELGHLYNTCGQFRALVRVRARNMPELYRSYGTVRHDLLEKSNQVAQRLHAVGVPQPFPKLVVPLKHMTASDYAGGCLMKPKALQDLETAQQPGCAPEASQLDPGQRMATALAALSPDRVRLAEAFIEGLSTGNKNAVAMLASVPCPVELTSATDAAAVEADAGPSPRNHLKRKAAHDAVHAAAASLSPPKRRQRVQNEDLGPAAAAAPLASVPAGLSGPTPTDGQSPQKSPRGTQARLKASPVRALHPPDPNNQEHREMFLRLYDSHSKENGLAVDFQGMALAWNKEVANKKIGGDTSAIHMTSERFLQRFHQQVVQKPAGLTATLHPAVLAEPSANVSTAGVELANSGVKVTVGNLLAKLIPMRNPPASAPAPEKKGRGGKGEKKYCRACCWKLARLVPMSSSHSADCEHREAFAQLSRGKKKVVDKTMIDLKKQLPRGDQCTV